MPVSFLKQASKPSIFLTALAVLVTGFCFTSPESFWIDEGHTYFKASRESVAEWYRALHAELGSDPQMPGFMFYAWCWEKLVPNTEYALRLCALPWLILAAYSLRGFRFAVLALMTSPFIIYYLSEFRPYLMQIGSTAVVIAGLHKMDRSERGGYALTLLGTFLLCSSSLVGVLWSIGIAIYLGVVHVRLFREAWFWAYTCVAFPLFAVLGLHYFQTLLNGNGAAPLGGNLILSLGAVGYELLGLQGLGPGKLELRENPMAVLGYWWIIGPAALLWVVALGVGLVGWFKETPTRRRIGVIAGIAVPVMMLLSLVVLRDFRVLGRHMAPLSILIVLLVAKALSLGTEGSGQWLSKTGFVAGISCLLLGFASCAGLRLLERHWKDDYRAAVAYGEMLTAEGRNVLWAADHRTAGYYHAGQDQRRWRLWHLTMPPPSLSRSEVVIASRPEAFDPKGALSRKLEERGYWSVGSFRAFTVWAPADFPNDLAPAQ